MFWTYPKLVQLPQLSLSAYTQGILAYLGTLRQRSRAPVVETVWCSSHAVRFNLREVASSAPQRMPFALIIYGLSRIHIGVPERYDCALAAPS